MSPARLVKVLVTQGPIGLWLTFGTALPLGFFKIQQTDGKSGSTALLVELLRAKKYIWT